MIEKAEQLLLTFDDKNEKVSRQITSVSSTRETYPKIQQKEVVKKVEDGVELHKEVESGFSVKGISGTLKKVEDALTAASIIAGYRYAIKNHYLSDIGSSFYTMIMKNEGLCDVKEIGTRNPKTLEFSPTGARVICSLQTFYKAAFGSLVNSKGNAIDGAGDIIQKAKETIMPIIEGKMPMPRAFASIHRNEKTVNEKNKKSRDFVIEGEPIRVYRKMSGAKDALIIDLDYFFFPLRRFNSDKSFKAKDGEPFLHKVAGQTVFMQLGSVLENKEKNRSPINIDTAIKILTAAQAAFELDYYSKGIIKENNQGRINIILKRSAVPNLYPSAVDSSTNRIRWGEFSTAVSLIGKYFYQAMKHTGIEQLLREKKDKNGNPLILIPAIDKGAEFPKDQPDKVYLKVDRLK